MDTEAVWKQYTLKRDSFFDIASYPANGQFILKDPLAQHFFEAREEIIAEAASKICRYFKEKGLIVGLDLFAPFISRIAGQNYTMITQHADFIKPILAIYRQMLSKRKHININELMVSINRIISENIEIQQPDVKNNVMAESRQFDISQIDFALLAKEFSKVKRKNILLKDLEDLIQERLSSMIEANPNRVDYYQRYMDIIEQYNSEQDRTTIEKTFMDLMNLAQSMSTEEQRYVREGFTSDEELSIYDLLFSDNLSKADIDKIKKLATELLQKIKERISHMDHWTDKDETRATVQNLIRDTLYMGIPDSMFDQLDHYREAIYTHIYTHYKDVA